MTTQEYSIEKTMVECYKIRIASKHLYADITIDTPGDNCGRITIASSYGSWEHYWGACGQSFKGFLIGLDIHYTAGKFGTNRWFDHDATLSLLREQIKNHGCKVERRVMYAEIQLLEDCLDVNSFCSMAYQCDMLPKLWDTGPDIVYGINPSFQNFWSILWPIFVQQLKSEIG